MSYPAPTIQTARFPEFTVLAFGESFDVFVMSHFEDGKRVVCPKHYDIKILSFNEEVCVVALDILETAPPAEYASVIVHKKTDAGQHRLIAALVYSYHNLQVLIQKDWADIRAKALVPYHEELGVDIVLSAQDIIKLYLDKKKSIT